MFKNPNFRLAKIAVLLIGLAISACQKVEQSISDLPVINLESVDLEKDQMGNDSVIHIKIGYTDGDGDIGLSDADTLPPFDLNSPYNHNLPIKIFYKTDTSFKQLLDQQNEPIVFHERVPVITPEGKNKTITGSITVHLPANPLNLEPKEMKFEINLIDRALNISNTVTTDDISLSH
ncbi:hypothetical protein GYB22_09680 [bacterium]|nr:hypothetical protein [bacterium]